MPLLEQFACEGLTNRMAGPVMNSGDGLPIKVTPMTNEEYLWEPVPAWIFPPALGFFSGFFVYASTTNLGKLPGEPCWSSCTGMGER